MNSTLLPLSLCLEDTNARPQDDRYMQCVALVGRKPGLAITIEGQIGWQLEGPVACELWRGADGNLVLYRPEASPDLVLEVHRSGRSLVVARAKPVILRHGDDLRIGGGRWKVHIHGSTREISPPSPLRRNVAAALAVLAVSAVLPACDEIAVRNNPPDPVYVPPDASDEEAGQDGPEADVSVSDAKEQ